MTRGVKGTRKTGKRITKREAEAMLREERAHQTRQRHADFHGAPVTGKVSIAYTPVDFVQIMGERPGEACAIRVQVDPASISNGRGGKRRGAGRPPKPPSERRTSRIDVYATDAERAILDAWAADAELPLSTLVLALALRAAKRSRP